MEMKVKEIKIFNFKQYKYEQHIKFSTDKDKNVTIILGENSSGKTNLLEAFKWCLYDQNHLNPVEILNWNTFEEMLNGYEENVFVEIVFLYNNTEYVIRKSQKFIKNEKGNIEASAIKKEMKYRDDNAFPQIETNKIDDIINKVIGTCYLLDNISGFEKFIESSLVLDTPFSNIDEEQIKKVAVQLSGLVNQVILIINNKDWELLRGSIRNKVGHIYKIDIINYNGTYSKIRKQGNNLFKFATSELSQDAIISWICNNYNFKLDNIELYNLANEIIHIFLGDMNIGSIEGIRVIRQFKNIDVLLIVNNKYAIIIEDKTYTSEHNDQINKYKDILINKIKEEETKSEFLPCFIEENIRTVYLKTGFHYPLDKSVEADYRMTGLELYNILLKYEGKSEILDDYIIKLKSDLDWYKKIENKYKAGETDLVLKHYYGQYLLLKDMFGEMDSFSHGSSYGRPWSNHNIAVVKYKKNNEEMGVDRKFYIFCRIDKRRDTYYVSIRQYDRELDKKNITMVDQKKNAFYQLRNIFKETCKSIDKLKSEIGKDRYKLGGNNGGYYESEFGIFFFGDEDNQVNIKEFPKIFEEFLLIFKSKLKDEFQYK